MAAPITIMQSGLAGFGASDGQNPADWAMPFANRAEEAAAQRTAGLITLGMGLAALAGGYALYKGGHPVAGVVVGLLFGSGVVVGPIMLTKS